MIDLRSDTVTRPTEAMILAMSAAEVGDDVYGEDPTVRRLEEHVAGLLGHEAGLFCVTGSMANQLGVALQVAPGQEVLCDVRAHVARAEMGAHGSLHGITMRTWSSPLVGELAGVAEITDIEQMISPDAGPYLVSTALLSLENTHNFAGGTVQPWHHLLDVHRLARENGLRLHLDGARLANAHVAAGVSMEAYGGLFDTVSLCLSKGLGAPVGSVLVGSRTLIDEARVLRKRLGGGWRQAGSLAAAGLYAVQHNVERLADDHAAAAGFAARVADSAPEACHQPPATNIVVVATGETPATELAARAREMGVLVSVVASRQIRAVAHLDVTLSQAEEAGRVIGSLLTHPVANER